MNNQHMYILLSHLDRQACSKTTDSL